MRRRQGEWYIDWMDYLRMAWFDGLCTGSSFVWSERGERLKYLRVTFWTTWGWLTAAWSTLFDAPREGEK